MILASRACLEHFRAILDAAGCASRDVGSCTIYIANIPLWPECNAIYAASFGPHRRPVR